MNRRDGTGWNSIAIVAQGLGAIEKPRSETEAGSSRDVAANGCPQIRASASAKLMCSSGHVTVKRVRDDSNECLMCIPVYHGLSRPVDVHPCSA